MRGRERAIHSCAAGPFAALPMGPSADAELGGAPNVSAIVWTEHTPIADQLLRLDGIGGRE